MRYPTPAITRLHSKYEIDKKTGCWNWTSHVDWNGYARLWSNRAGRKELAHRIIYHEEVEEIPLGWHVHHLCHNKICVNPDHLESISPSSHSSLHSGSYWREQTHCIHGHEYIESNIYHWRGKRMCRECRRVNDRNFKARRKVIAGAVKEAVQ